MLQLATCLQSILEHEADCCCEIIEIQCHSIRVLVVTTITILHMKEVVRHVISCIIILHSASQPRCNGLW